MDKKKTIRTTGVRNQDLIETGIQMRIDFESPEQIDFENSRFRTINQQDQYFNEKTDSGNYRFYGKIDQVMNTRINDNIKREPTFSELDIDNGNWDVVLLKPTNKHFNYEKKGETKISSQLENGRTYDFDLENGLPILKTTPKVISGRVRMGFNSVFGHNLKVDDIVKITKDNAVIPTGNYRVLDINGNNFYVNYIDNQNQETLISIADLPSEDINFIAVEKGSPLFLLTTDIYFKKVVNNLTCEYYVKELEVIDKFDSVHKAAFSVNIFNQKSLLFTDQTIHNFTASLNHRNEPLDEVFIGIIKRQNLSGTLSAIESNFSNLIDFTEEYQGIETIHDRILANTTSGNFLNNISNNIVTTNSNIKLSKATATAISGVTRIGTNLVPNLLKGRYDESLKVGDIVKHSICEYNPQQIIETEINSINHTFRYRNDIKYKYNPFHKIKIRDFSEYIEDSNNVELVPPYADYSEKYQTFRWRNLLPVGYFEGNRGVNFPFLNDTFYVYQNVVFTLRTNDSPKYAEGSGATRLPSTTKDLFESIFNIKGVDKDFQVYTGNPNC